LSKDEISDAYALFDSLMKEVVVHLKTASGQGGSFLDVHWFWVWWDIGREADVREAVVIYALTEGKIPSTISQVIAGSSKSYATRQDVMKLLTEVLTYFK
ncbi:MAG: hypothetical protein HYY61_00595, partial [Deltaproteobacteria bacterium]|nr:hypothetical protein [Deltaproteobacteria bacterium]